MLERSDEKRLDMLGSTIDGRWQLTRLVGHGGMSTVYEAVDIDGQHVALKLLRPRYTSNEHVVRRFLREARLANAVGHARVVRVDHVGLHGNVPYLVMPLLAGENLDALLHREGPLEASRALSLIDQVLDVFIAAHAQGILHRDIKPANLHLEPSGQLRVLDFGVGSLPENMHTTVRTNAGSLLGTPGFMSPEQARADWEHVTAQSDIWSLGATLFTLLSNRLVHEGRSPNEVLGMAMTRPAPSLGLALRKANPRLVAFVDKALKYEPRERFESVRAMQLALWSLLDNPDAMAEQAGAAPVFRTTLQNTTRDAVQSTHLSLSDRRTVLMYWGTALALLSVLGFVGALFGPSYLASKRVPELRAIALMPSLHFPAAAQALAPIHPALSEVPAESAHPIDASPAVKSASNASAPTAAARITRKIRKQPPEAQQQADSSDESEVDEAPGHRTLIRLLPR